MIAPATALVSAALALVFTTCGASYALDLSVTNESPGDVTIEIVAGTEGGPTTEPSAYFSEVVEAGSESEWALERPGPGSWTILVDGRVATDSDAWPGDNPTLDFTIVIEEGGSVSVEDT